MKFTFHDRKENRVLVFPEQTLKIVYPDIHPFYRTNGSGIEMIVGKFRNGELELEIGNRMRLIRRSMETFTGVVPPDVVTGFEASAKELYTRLPEVKASVVQHFSSLLDLREQVDIIRGVAYGGYITMRGSSVFPLSEWIPMMNRLTIPHAEGIDSHAIERSLTRMFLQGYRAACQFRLENNRDIHPFVYKLSDVYVSVSDSLLYFHEMFCPKMYALDNNHELVRPAHVEINENGITIDTGSSRTTYPIRIVDGLKMEWKRPDHELETNLFTSGWSVEVYSLLPVILNLIVAFSQTTAEDRTSFLSELYTLFKYSLAVSPAKMRQLVLGVFGDSLSERQVNTLVETFSVLTSPYPDREVKELENGVLYTPPKSDPRRDVDLILAVLAPTSSTTRA